jgi:hypothetical protein
MKITEAIRKHKIVIVIAIGLLLLVAGIVAAAVSRQYAVPTSGDTQSISLGVPTSIDWGLVANGTLTTKNIQVTNNGNIPVTLSLSTVSLSPSIIALTLGWDYTGAILNPSQTITIQLSQTITATGAWNYSTVITATG